MMGHPRVAGGHVVRKGRPVSVSQGTAEQREPLLRPWLPADLLDNAARTISENKTIMLGLPVLAAIALLAVQAALMEVAVPGGLSGFFGADDPFQQAGAA